MMARRRMFSLDIIDTDKFLEMPQSSRLLYYELCIRADDDGFISNPLKIQKMVGCSNDDFNFLILKQFIIPFDSGVIVIKHWRIHNYIQRDRYKPTIHLKEKSSLNLEQNGSYNLKNDTCIQNVSNLDTQVRLELGKNRVVEDSNQNIDNNLISERNGNGDENFRAESGRDGNSEENLFEFTEKIFGRPLSPTEVEIINQWENTDLTRYAIKQSELAQARNVKYVNRILFEYKKCGIKSVAEAEERDKRFQERKSGKFKPEKKIRDYEVDKVYEVDGIKFKYNADGKREIL